MALLYKNRFTDDAELSLWLIEEDEDFFLAHLELHEEEEQELSVIKGKRRLEWLSSRYLLQLMLVDLGYSEPGNRIPVSKDEFGKPYLKRAGLHISFSHSHERVAVLLAQCSVGVDVQFFVSKIEVIAHRFLREAEFDSLETSTRLNHMHLYWGAKESLYKAYGRKDLDFKNQVVVEPFEYRVPTGQTQGEVSKNGFYCRYDISYEISGDYFLVWCFATGDT